MEQATPRSGGGAVFPELLTGGVQYPTRNMKSKKFVRALCPNVLCASLKSQLARKLVTLNPVVVDLRDSTGHNCLGKTSNLYHGNVRTYSPSSFMNNYLGHIGEFAPFTFV